MRIIIIFSTALALAGCGGGSSDDFLPNQAPQITILPSDQDISANAPSGDLTITATDDGGAAQLTANAVSSDQSVIANSNLVITGSNGNFSLQITPVPDTLGTASISVTVTDAQGRATAGSFAVNVVPQPAQFTDFVRAVFSDDANAVPRDVNARAFIDDASAFDDLLIAP